MNAEEMRVLTILAEAGIADRLIAEIRGQGARGYFITEGQGEWSRALGSRDWYGTSVRIETVVLASVADAILRRLAESWFPHYAVFATVAPVGVVRFETYS